MSLDARLKRLESLIAEKPPPDPFAGLHGEIRSAVASVALAAADVAADANLDAFAAGSKSGNAFLARVRAEKLDRRTLDDGGRARVREIKTMMLDELKEIAQATTGKWAGIELDQCPSIQSPS